jgi:hypothetical protein
LQDSCLPSPGQTIPVEDVVDAHYVQFFRISLRHESTIQWIQVVKREIHQGSQVFRLKRQEQSCGSNHCFWHYLLKRFGEKQFLERTLDSDFPQAGNADKILVCIGFDFPASKGTEPGIAAEKTRKMRGYPGVFSVHVFLNVW